MTPRARDSLVKRSLTIAGHRTSVTLEAPFWESLKAIAAKRGLSLNQLATEIDETRPGNLSSALRLYAFEQAKRGLA